MEVDGGVGAGLFFRDLRLEVGDGSTELGFDTFNDCLGFGLGVL